MRIEIDLAETDFKVAAVIMNSQVGEPLVARPRNHSMDKRG